MRTIPGSKLRTYDELSCGRVFIGETATGCHYCMKTFEMRGEPKTHESLVVLSPGGTENESDQPRVLQSNQIKDGLTLELDDTYFLIPTKIELVMIETQYTPESGSVFIFSDGGFLCVEQGRGHLLLNLETGELVAGYPVGGFARVRSWQLVRETAPDVEELLSYPPPKEPAQLTET